MIKVDQETLCDFCTEHYEGSTTDNCEGRHCEDIREIYLEDKGICCENPDKTFGNLIIGQTIYLIYGTSEVPEICERVVDKISNNDGNFMIYYSPNSRIEIDDISLDSQGTAFVNKKDAEQELERICTKRIIELSKVIGSLEK